MVESAAGIDADTDTRPAAISTEALQAGLKENPANLALRSLPGKQPTNPPLPRQPTNLTNQPGAASRQPNQPTPSRGGGCHALARIPRKFVRGR